VLYYCGHAKLSARGDLYLCPNDAELDYLDATAISMEWTAKRALNESSASQLVILLDCIYSLTPDAIGQVDIPSILVSNLGQGQGKYVLSGCTVLDRDVAERGRPCPVWCAGSCMGSKPSRPMMGQHPHRRRDLPLRAGPHRSRSAREQAPQQGLQHQLQPRRGRPAHHRSPHRDGAARKSRVLPGHPRRPRRRAPGAPVGDGVFGSGPLSAFRLVSALIETAGLEAGMRLDERYTLATAAEYLLLVFGGERGAFLKRSPRTARAEPDRCRCADPDPSFPRGHADPWIVVSASYDWVFESLLEQAGLPSRWSPIS
jgi:hypothetical protein